MYPGESEIVAGFHVEYSNGIRNVFPAEYMNLILISILTSIMFLADGYRPSKELFRFYFAFIPVLYALLKTYSLSCLYG